MQKSLKYELDFFLDLARQTAVKRVTHKKFWNVFLHVVTSLFISWSGFYLLGSILPSIIAKAHLVLIIASCIFQDAYLGAMISPLYVTTFYHAMYVSRMTFLQIVSLLVLVILFQVFVGQKWIENTEPFSGPIKSNSTLFAVFDFHNDIFLAPFHYLVTFLIRLDFKENLRWQSDIELRKIMTRMQPTP